MGPRAQLSRSCSNTITGRANQRSLQSVFGKSASNAGCSTLHDATSTATPTAVVCTESSPGDRPGDVCHHGAGNGCSVLLCLQFLSSSSSGDDAFLCTQQFLWRQQHSRTGHAFLPSRWGTALAHGPRITRPRHTPMSKTSPPSQCLPCVGGTPCHHMQAATNNSSIFRHLAYLPSQ